MYSFVDWIEAIRYRWKLIALVTAAMALLAVLYLAVTPSTYTARASLLIDRGQPTPVDDANNKGSSGRSVIATQADLIRSPAVAGEAAARAGLDRDPAYVAEWREQTNQRTPYDQWIRRRMLSALEVTPGKDTNVLSITATTDSPAEAARIANGFAQAAVAVRYRLKTEPAKAYATWLQSRMGPAREELLQAQRALSNFVRASGLSQGEDLGAEGSQMADMAGQLASAEARAAAARQSAFAEAQSRGEAERSSAIQNLRQQVATKSANLAELETQFGPEYPQVQRTKAELSTLQSQLNSAVSSTSSTFNAARNAQAAAERQAAAASEARLRSLAAQQRARLESKGVNVAQYTTLKNDFSAAQRNYNELNERLTAMRLQSAVPLAEVQVLDSASRFMVSRSPNATLILLLALLLGGILGSLAAIILEWLNPRVRSWGGVERLLGVSVLGRVALPRQRPQALGDRRGQPLLPAGAA